MTTVSPPTLDETPTTVIMTPATAPDEIPPITTIADDHTPTTQMLRREVEDPRGPAMDVTPAEPHFRSPIDNSPIKDSASSVPALESIKAGQAMSSDDQGPDVEHVPVELQVKGEANKALSSPKIQPEQRADDIAPPNLSFEGAGGSEPPVSHDTILLGKDADSFMLDEGLHSNVTESFAVQVDKEDPSLHQQTQAQNDVDHLDGSIVSIDFKTAQADEKANMSVVKDAKGLSPSTHVGKAPHRSSEHLENDDLGGQETPSDSLDDHRDIAAFSVSSEAEQASATDPLPSSSEHGDSESSLAKAADVEAEVGTAAADIADQSSRPATPEFSSLELVTQPHVELDSEGSLLNRTHGETRDPTSHHDSTEEQPILGRPPSLNGPPLPSSPPTPADVELAAVDESGAVNHTANLPESFETSPTVGVYASTQATQDVQADKPHALNEAAMPVDRQLSQDETQQPPASDPISGTPADITDQEDIEAEIPDMDSLDLGSELGSSRLPTGPSIAGSDEADVELAEQARGAEGLAYIRSQPSAEPSAVASERAEHDKRVIDLEVGRSPIAATAQNEDSTTEKTVGNEAAAHVTLSEDQLETLPSPALPVFDLEESATPRHGHLLKDVAAQLAEETPRPASEPPVALKVLEAEDNGNGYKPATIPSTPDGHQDAERVRVTPTAPTSPVLVPITSFEDGVQALPVDSPLLPVIASDSTSTGEDVVGADSQGILDSSLHDQSEGGINIPTDEVVNSSDEPLPPARATPSRSSSDASRTASEASPLTRPDLTITPMEEKDPEMLNPPECEASAPAADKEVAISNQDEFNSPDTQVDDLLLATEADDQPNTFPSPSRPTVDVVSAPPSLSSTALHVDTQGRSVPAIDLGTLAPQIPADDHTDQTEGIQELHVFAEPLLSLPADEQSPQTHDATEDRSSDKSAVDFGAVPETVRSRDVSISSDAVDTVSAAQQQQDVQQSEATKMTTPQPDVTEQLAAIDIRDTPTEPTLASPAAQSHAAADAKPTLLSKDTEGEVPLSTLAAQSGATVVAAASAAPAAVQEIDAPLSEAVVAPVASSEEQRAAESGATASTSANQASSSSTAATAAPALVSGVTTSTAPTGSDHRPATNSGEGTWQLKEISWPDPRVGGERRTTKILVQDANGPCSLLALANILILRGSIHITPKARQVVEYNYLSALIADFLISRPSDDSSLSLESALSILPSMTQGLNIDVCFKDIWSFKGTGDAGELAIFERCGVPLVHGWVADQSGPEYAAVTQAETYDGAQMAIVAGMELQDKENKTADEIATVKNAHAIDAFVNSTATQITYAGLFSLTSSLEQGSIVAFFRNSHLGVLYRRPPAPPSESTDPNDASDALLYQLVTDSSFANEPEVAWESLVDLDGAASAFVNGDFTRSAPGGGEYAGLSAAHAARVTARRERGEVQAGTGSEHGDAALVPFPPSSSDVGGDGDGARASQRVNRVGGSGDQNGERTLSKAASAWSLTGLIELSSRLARMLQAEEDQQSAQQLSDRTSERRPSSGNNPDRQRNQSNASNLGYVTVTRMEAEESGASGDSDQRRTGSRPTPSNRQSGTSNSNKPSKVSAEDKKKCLIM